ncbi:unnamed protein product [Protopolystoma xenopodis]|uniref:Uncharacterized protein n=1 Tax=Protopolystoma xenopodis TaxID=117903 RepID=A0A3S4ZVC4_9PLAT|nr:unnamed protein product [Protopolystoma xenopodis]
MLKNYNPNDEECHFHFASPLAPEDEWSTESTAVYSPETAASPSSTTGVETSVSPGSIDSTLQPDWTSTPRGAQAGASVSSGSGREDAYGGTVPFRLGLPLRAGPVSSGSRRWPLFGQLVGYNLTAIRQLDLECHEALIKGLRLVQEPTQTYLVRIQL